jgi:NADH dehydrogenase [ubiquinone] 1 alpha subcomplex assembly factor 7
MIKKNYKIPLDKFINFSLYDKKSGYYMKKNPFGITGDFTTAPNISRLFSEMLAIWTISYWQMLGSPKHINLIELGSGNGEMIKVMIECFKRFPTFYGSCNIIIYEKSPFLIKVQKKKIKGDNIKWVSSLKRINNYPGIFIANEFFDAIPIKQYFKEKDFWFERFVHFSNDKKPSFDRKKVNIKLIEKKLKLKISCNQNFIEYSPLGSKYLEDITKLIKKNNGGLLIIDYGYYDKKMRNTLQAISHKKYSNVLENVGNSDITYNINFHLLKKIVNNIKKLKTNFTTQKKFLLNMGIKKRAEALCKNKTFTEKADIYYRLKRLIDEKEMGDLFKVMLITKQDNSFNIGF